MLLSCLLIIGGNSIFQIGDTHHAYASAEEEWALLGKAGFSAGEASAPKLAVDQLGTTYVAYSDRGANSKVTVMKYSESGDWQLVGDRGLSVGSASGITLVLDQAGTPYIGYQDSGANSKATVMKYSESDGWELVGEAGFTPDRANYPSLALDQAGNPYIAYKDGASGKANVMRYIEPTGWELVGSADFSEGEANSSFSLVLDQADTPYVAFQDEAYKATVMMYSSNEWKVVGQAGFSGGYATSPSLVMNPSGQPYIVFQEDTNKMTVMTYRDEISSWETVGQPGFSPGSANSPSLAMDQTGTPFVVFKDGANGNKATLMKYSEQNGWELVGQAGFSAGVVSTPSLALDQKGTPYVVYQDAFNSSKATVMKFGAKALYTVTYDGNGAQVGSAPMDNQQYNEQAGVTVLNNTGTLEKIGYTFGGWNTAADGSGVNYSAGDTLLIGTSNVTLFAKWLVSNNGGTNPPNGSDNSSGGNGGNGSNPGGGSTSGPASAAAGTASSGGGAVNSGVSILVNGKPEKAGTLRTANVNGQNVLTLTVDEQAVMQKLNTEGMNAVVTLPINGGNKDRVIGELTGRLVKLMANKESVIVLQTDAASYTLPFRLMEINTLAQQLGADNHLEDMVFHLEIAPASAETIYVAETAAHQKGYALIGSLFDFNITATYEGKSVSVDRFNQYVERAITLSDEVDPSEVTTGVVVDKDGGVRHVPTKITQVNGVNHAQINSLTNSAYGLVWNPRTFADVAGHWAQTEVNDMGSRMVIRGISDTLFNPDTSITRSEFAAVIVRALGLQTGEENDRFSDVNPSDWYADVVSAASNLGLIDGYKDGTFRPTQKITREEAMMIINRTMKLTNLDRKLDIDTGQDLSRYKDMDMVSYWAKEAVDFSLQSGLVSGRSNATIAPKSMITRAETAALIRRLLQHSGLI